MTPPNTPLAKRARRRQGSSEQRPIPIQSEIMEEDFRTGAPRLCKLPIVVDIVEPGSRVRLTWDRSLKSEVIQVLKTWGIVYEGPSLLQRRWKHDRVSTVEETETIMIGAFKNEDDYSLWYHVCAEIRQLCLSHNPPKMNVEIADPRGLVPTRSSGVEKGHAIIGAWPTIKPQIQTILAEKDWVAIDVLRRGKSSIPGDNPVTIVITIEVDSVIDWIDVREQVVLVLDQKNLLDVAVDIGRGRIWCGFTDSEVWCKESWPIQASLGDSIGCCCWKKESGTLGGFVELTFPDGTTRVLGLTCFHCIAPEELVHPSMQRWEQKGIYPDDLTNNLTVEQPSFGDYEASIKYYTHRIDELNDKEHIATKRKMNDPNDFVAPCQRRLYEAKEERVKYYEDLLKEARTFFMAGHISLGSVFAPSGKRRVNFLTGESATYDWALLNIRPTRMSHNELPSAESLPRGAKDYYFPADSRISTIASPKLDGHLFKMGRTTGITWGRCNGILKSLIKSWELNVNGQSIEVEGSEQSVVGRPIRGDNEFGMPGDSGAFVIDELGSLVGLYWGGNEYSGVSYYTEIRHVFEDIMMITGARSVRLPT